MVKPHFPFALFLLMSALSTLATQSEITEISEPTAVVLGEMTAPAPMSITRTQSPPSSSGAFPDLGKEWNRYFRAEFSRLTASLFKKKMLNSSTFWDLVDNHGEGTACESLFGQEQCIDKAREFFENGVFKGHLRKRHGREEDGKGDHYSNDICKARQVRAGAMERLSAFSVGTSQQAATEEMHTVRTERQLDEPRCPCLSFALPLIYCCYPYCTLGCCWC